ncbi:MAG TPA: tetratricopeptide repeat protein [Candidatus Hydrogenedentes bacterium]|nr:tetratricopeptide repeat protein [Candidatus Hydrogenedentota bacterium]
MNTKSPAPKTPAKGAAPKRASTKGASSKSILQENWHLVALVVVCLLGAVIFGLRKGPAKEEAIGESIIDQAGALSARGGGPQEPPKRTRGGAEERARETIEAHRRKVVEDPDREDAPILINAMGNLYMQKLRDYERAVECYEQILTDHPNSDETRSALVNLANCYEKLNDLNSARRTYRRMLAAFPEGTQERNFAQAQLDRF